MSTRILIIEDAEHLRTVLKITLEFKGYDVYVAANGQEGLEAAKESSFDLIFCDIEMPVMDGLEFLTRYRAEIDAETPIVMLTAEDRELIEQALQRGATAALCKPFEPIKLLEEIQKYAGPEANK